jgi:hypothetical protein
LGEHKAQVNSSAEFVRVHGVLPTPTTINYLQGAKGRTIQPETNTDSSAALQTNCIHYGSLPITPPEQFVAKDPRLPSPTLESKRDSLRALLLPAHGYDVDIDLRIGVNNLLATQDDASIMTRTFYISPTRIQIYIHPLEIAISAHTVRIEAQSIACQLSNRKSLLVRGDGSSKRKHYSEDRH